MQEQNESPHVIYRYIQELYRGAIWGAAVYTHHPIYQLKALESLQ